MTSTGKAEQQKDGAPQGAGAVHGHDAQWLSSWQSTIAVVGTWGHGAAACFANQCRLDMSKKCFTIGAVRHRHRLPREVVVALPLTVFKARLDGALSRLVWCLVKWLATLMSAAGLELDDL